MKNNTYDKLKNMALVILPAIGALYFGVAAIWGLPKAEEVVGTIAVLTTFVGVVVKAAQVSYNKGPGDNVNPPLQ